MQGLVSDTDTLSHLTHLGLCVDVGLVSDTDTLSPLTHLGLCADAGPGV